MEFKKKDGGPIEYKPGDVFNVRPRNSTEDVDDLFNIFETHNLNIKRDQILQLEQIHDRMFFLNILFRDLRFVMWLKLTEVLVGYLVSGQSSSFIFLYPYKEKSSGFFMVIYFKRSKTYLPTFLLLVDLQLQYNQSHPPSVKITTVYLLQFKRYSCRDLNKMYSFLYGPGNFNLSICCWEIHILLKLQLPYNLKRFIITIQPSYGWTSDGRTDCRSYVIRSFSLFAYGTLTFLQFIRITRYET